MEHLELCISHTLCEIKTLLYSFNSRHDTAGEKICELEDMEIKFLLHDPPPREKYKITKNKNINSASGTCYTASVSQVSVIPNCLIMCNWSSRKSIRKQIKVKEMAKILSNLVNNRYMPLSGSSMSPDRAKHPPKKCLGTS